MSARTRPVLLWVLVLILWSENANAYSWMLRHGYAQCSTCHVDPSGAGLLTLYGRGLAEEVLRTHYGEEEDADSDPSLFLGAIKLPEPLLLGGDFRLMTMRRKTEGVAFDTRTIVMQADLEASVHFGNFVAAGSVGYAPEGALVAAITRGRDANVISRQHWLGYWVVPSTVLVRAGRLLMPFGIRAVEHTAWTRTLTHTNINDDQQHGVAVAYTGSAVRAELMAIAGNYQLRPDLFRERGGAMFAEAAVGEGLGLGVSGLVTHRELDPQFFRETWRHAYGVHGRWAPSQLLVLMSEWDYAFLSPKADQRREGLVSFTQVDLEPVQGIHLIATGEIANVGIDAPPFSYAAWLSYAWFFMSHADVRVDSIFESQGSHSGRTNALLMLLQGHVYL